MNEQKATTCSLWVDHFEIEFTKAGDRQWFHRTDQPGLLSKVLKAWAGAKGQKGGEKGTSMIGICQGWTQSS